MSRLLILFTNLIPVWVLAVIMLGMVINCARAYSVPSLLVVDWSLAEGKLLAPTGLTPTQARQRVSFVIERTDPFPRPLDHYFLSR